MGFQVYNSQGQELQNLTGSAGGDLTGTYPNPTISGQVLRTDKVLHVRDEKASGTVGGTFTSGAWRTRDLNTVKTNTITGASLASNQITLPAGTYWLDATAPVCDVQNHQVLFYNVTGAANLIVGSSGYAGKNTDVNQTYGFVRGLFTLSASSACELRHRCYTTITSYGFGNPSFYGTETYAEVVIWQVA